MVNASGDESYCSRAAFPLASCGCFEPSLSAFPAASLSCFWWPLVVLGDAGGVCSEGMLKAACVRMSASISRAAGCWLKEKLTVSASTAGWVWASCCCCSRATPGCPAGCWAGLGCLRRAGRWGGAGLDGVWPACCDGGEVCCRAAGWACGWTSALLSGDATVGAVGVSAGSTGWKTGVRLDLKSWNKAETQFLKGVFWSVPVSVELQQPELSCSAAGGARLKVGPSGIARLQQAERGLSWHLWEFTQLGYF